MDIEIRTTMENVDWSRVSSILDHYGLSHEAADIQRTIFERSYAVAFVYDGDLLVGCGRALSDGISQAAIYNVALEEAYHGRQLGRAIIEALIEQVKNCTIILYTHPQTIALYEKLGFRRQKTGFVMLNKSRQQEEWMEQEGFLLPQHYRFGDNKFEAI